MGTEWRALHDGVAGAAVPGRVPAAVAEASLMTYQHLTRAETVTIGASRRRMGDPLPSSGLYELA